MQCVSCLSKHPEFFNFQCYLCYSSLDLYFRNDAIVRVAWKSFLFPVHPVTDSCCFPRRPNYHGDDLWTRHGCHKESAASVCTTRFVYFFTCWMIMMEIKRAGWISFYNSLFSTYGWQVYFR